MLLLEDNNPYKRYNGVFNMAFRVRRMNHMYELNNGKDGPRLTTNIVYGNGSLNQKCIYTIPSDSNYIVGMASIDEEQKEGDSIKGEIFEQFPQALVLHFAAIETFNSGEVPDLKNLRKNLAKLLQ